MLLQNNCARDSFLTSLFFIFPAKINLADFDIKKIPRRLKKKTFLILLLLNLHQFFLKWHLAVRSNKRENTRKISWLRFSPYWGAKTCVAFPFNIAGYEQRHGPLPGKGKDGWTFISIEFSDDPAGCKRCPVVAEPVRRPFTLRNWIIRRVGKYGSYGNRTGTVG